MREEGEQRDEARAPLGLDDISLYLSSETFWRTRTVLDTCTAVPTTRLL